jgi:hypothetical protein
VPTNAWRPITSDSFLKGGNGLAAVLVLFGLSIRLSLYPDLGFDDLGLSFLNFWSDFGDFKILGLFGEMERFGDLDFILPDC